MSKQFDTALGPEYYDSVPDYPNLAVQHVCEAALTRFFGDQLDVSFLPDADQVLADTGEGTRYFAGKHLHNIDSPLFATAIATVPDLEDDRGNTRPLMKRELLEVPVLKSLVTALGGIALDRQGSLASGLMPNTEALIARHNELIALGQNFAIWPEGGRQVDDGQVKQLRPGVAKLAIAGAKHADRETSIVPYGVAFRRRRFVGTDKKHIRRPVVVIGKALSVNSDSKVSDILEKLHTKMQAAQDVAQERAAA